MAHRDSNGAISGSGKARSEAGHGGVACDGSPAGVGEEPLGLELRWGWSLRSGAQSMAELKAELLVC